MLQRKHLTPGQAVQKIKQYCAYQERNHAEVKEKLYAYGLNTAEVEQIVAQLIEEDYLNEQRYASLYAGGKFRMKKWGRVKIKHALKQKQVSEYCIRKGLGEIPETDYLATLRQLFGEKKKDLGNEKNIFIKKSKLRGYLLQKGYEQELIAELLKEHYDEA